MEHDRPIYCLIDCKLQVLAACTTKSGASLVVIILAKLPLPFWFCLYKQTLPFQVYLMCYAMVEAKTIMNQKGKGNYVYKEVVDNYLVITQTC